MKFVLKVTVIDSHDGERETRLFKTYKALRSYLNLARLEMLRCEWVQQ